jgi:hypothetical protein
MLWVTIILAIIQALPTIISLIQEILAAVENKPRLERLRVHQELQSHLLAWHHGGSDEGLLQALHAMGQILGCPSAKPAA